VAEPLGAISAFGVPSSELETARRIRGRSSALLVDELLDEFPAEVLELSSELVAARRSLGRSGSLSFDALLDELLVLPSELDAARRNWGRLGLLLAAELLDELLDELALVEEAEPSEGLFGRGCVGSSAASDAIECSSGVPSLTIVIVTAL